MARSYTPFSTTAKISRGFFDGRRVNVLRQNVTFPAAGNCWGSIGAALPVNARVLWSRLVNTTAVGVGGGIGTATTAPGGWALIAVPSSGTASASAPPSTASVVPSTTVTNGFIINRLNSTASSQTARNIPFSENYQNYLTNQIPCINTYTVPAALFVVPVLTNTVSTTIGFQCVGTTQSVGTVTVAAYFGTSTADTSTYTGYVELYFEDYQEYA